ncbi:MAG: hydrogenase maturation protease [Syntrophobacteraceae bacterium]
MEKILVLGLGNLLLCDEGVGVHAAQALLNTRMPEGVTVRDTGTAILDAIPDLEEADFVIVVDAVKADGDPGTVYRVPFGDMLHPECIGSMHGFDLSRVLALAGRETSPEVIVIGVEPGVIDWSIELSPAVADALPAVIDQVMLEIGEYLEKARGPQSSRPSAECVDGTRPA